MDKIEFERHYTWNLYSILRTHYVQRPLIEGTTRIIVYKIKNNDKYTIRIINSSYLRGIKPLYGFRLKN